MNRRFGKWNPRYDSPNIFGASGDAFKPEIWAQESLMILEENLVAANLVHRDFENEIARYGDVINTRRPGRFTARRKVDGDPITKQPATAETVQVRLDQHFHTSFTIYDVELSKSFIDLVDLYLKPAIRSIAVQIDNVVLSQKYNFIANSVGRLGTDPSSGTLIDLDTLLNTNLVPEDSRVGILTPAAKGALLKDTSFTSGLAQIADPLGAGNAVREATIGKLYTVGWLMSTNNKNIATGNTIAITLLVNNSAGYVAGDTAIVVDGLTGSVTDGQWVTFAGDNTPQYIVSHTNTTAGNTTGIVISPGLKRAVANDAIITRYTPGQINLVAGYAANWPKFLVQDTFTVAPREGQLITIGTDLTRYGSLPMGLDPTDGTTPISTLTNLSLSTPLGAAQVNDAKIFVGPAGNYNWVFHKNAVALVTRPLANVPPGMGAKSFVANYRGLSLRITISYDPTYQGMTVTADILAGVKTLDSNLGALMYS